VQESNLSRAIKLYEQSLTNAGAPSPSDLLISISTQLDKAEQIVEVLYAQTQQRRFWQKCLSEWEAEIKAKRSISG
jgi:hypothetical protein